MPDYFKLVTRESSYTDDCGQGKNELKETDMSTKAKKTNSKTNSGRKPKNAETHKTQKKKVSAKSAETPNETSPQPAIDQDELEEQEDAAAAATVGAGEGNAAALAAATGNGEISASFKNFRHHPDMENFYRFIYENDLRHEALAILDDMMREKHERKAVKSLKSATHPS
jgi:predicted HNH restriction endonuclease